MLAVDQEVRYNLYPYTTSTVPLTLKCLTYLYQHLTHALGRLCHSCPYYYSYTYTYPYR